MPQWLDIVVKLTPTFVTLVIGAVASYIAHQQFRIGRDKLRLDLFSKRLEAYEKLQEFFVNIFRHGTLTGEGLQALAEARYKSRFLFGPETEKKLDELWNKAVDLQTFAEQIHGPGALPVGDERTSICKQKGELVKLMMREMEEAPKRYAKYLHFE